MIRVDQRAVILHKLGRKQIQQPLLGQFLYLLVFGGNGRIVVLDGGRQIAGQHLGGIVVEGQQRSLLGVECATKLAVFDQCQGMGHHGHLQAMFADVLFLHIAHQGPAVDKLHAGQMGEEVAEFKHGGSWLSTKGKEKGQPCGCPVPAKGDYWW